MIASQPTPPASAADGACYRVTATATGAWAGKEDRIAVLVAGAWHFVAPTEGLVLFDRTTGAFVIFGSQWQPASVVAVPSGGTIIDVQARAAMTALITALETMGVLAAPGT